jgi:hypothetical protein
MVRNNICQISWKQGDRNKKKMMTQKNGWSGSSKGATMGWMQVGLSIYLVRIQNSVTPICLQLTE